MSETSALLIPELRPEDVQDNILATVGDALTTLLEEKLTAESAAESNMEELATVADQTRLADAEDRSADAKPTIQKFRLRLILRFLYLKFELHNWLVSISLTILIILNRFLNRWIVLF